MFPYKIPPIFFALLIIDGSEKYSSKNTHDEKNYFMSKPILA